MISAVVNSPTMTLLICLRKLSLIESSMCVCVLVPCSIVKHHGCLGVSVDWRGMTIGWSVMAVDMEYGILFLNLWCITIGGWGMTVDWPVMTVNWLGMTVDDWVWLQTLTRSSKAPTTVGRWTFLSCSEQKSISNSGSWDRLSGQVRDLSRDLTHTNKYQSKKILRITNLK